MPVLKPLPHPSPHRQFKRLAQANAMTVAAGFRFSDGILLCADTEITHGSELKEKGTKVFPYRFKKSGNKAVFTFSGTVFPSRQCIQTMTHRIAASSPDKWGNHGLFAELAQELYDFHHKYIFKHPRYPYGDGPQVNLIVGTWCESEKILTLYQSDEESLVEVLDAEPFAVTGTGATFSRYVAKPMLPHANMKLADVLTVALYALKEAKDNVPACGIASEVITISKDGEIGCLGWLHSSHVERFAESFAAGIQHLFVDSCDLDSPDERVEERFETLRTIIQATRSHLKQQRQNRIGMPALLEHIVKRKTTEL